MSALSCEHTFGVDVMALVWTCACSLLRVQLALGAVWEWNPWVTLGFRDWRLLVEELYAFHSLGGFLGGLPNTAELWLTVPRGSH